MRIGINVPNDLYERFKPLRETYNLSQVCRDAIKTRIETYEKAIEHAKSDGMDEVANKLWLEYSAKTIVDWEAVGRDDAKVWAQLATLEDFENLFHNVSIRKKKGGDLGAFLWYRQIPGVKRFEYHYDEHKVWFARQWELNQADNPHAIAQSRYYDGWFSYITAVWQMLQKKIKTDAEARLKAYQQQAKPEVPKHLEDFFKTTGRLPQQDDQGKASVQEKATSKTHQT